MGASWRFAGGYWKSGTVGIREGRSEIRLYPVALDLQGRPCLVVGGGRVACRKVEGLVEAGAEVIMVAPEIDPGIAGRVRSVQREFEEADVAGMALVFACTDSPGVNARVAAAGRAAGAWVNRADLPSDCDFAGMSVVERGRLLFAVSTGTDSPAFSRWIRQELEQEFGPEYGELLDLVAALRPEVKERVPAPLRQEAWRQALDSGALEFLRAGDRDAALEALRAKLFGD